MFLQEEKVFPLCVVANAKKPSLKYRISGYCFYFFFCASVLFA